MRFMLVLETPMPFTELQTVMPNLPHNARLVSSLRAVAGQRTIYRSDTVAGLELDCFPSGKRIWRVRYRVGRGTARKFRAFKIGDANAVTLGQAIDKAREVLADVQVEGRDPQAEKVAPKSDFNSVIQGWTEWQKLNGRRTWERNRRQYELHVKKTLGSKGVSTITKQDVAVLLDKISSRAGGKAANRTQALISAALSWAADEGFIDANPVYRLRRRAAETPRERKVSEGEIRAIWRGTLNQPAQIGRVIRLLLLTGQRRSEVCQAARDEIDGLIWRIPRERTKNKLQHEVPLSQTAMAELTAAIVASEGSPFVFQARLRMPKPMNPTTPSAAFAEMMRSLKIVNLRLHDLRHIVATEMASMGIPIDIRQQVQNQITGRRQVIGSVYDQHKYIEEKRRALRLWAVRLKDIVGEKKRLKPLRW